MQGVAKDGSKKNGTVNADSKDAALRKIKAVGIVVNQIDTVVGEKATAAPPVSSIPAAVASVPSQRRPPAGEVIVSSDRAPAYAVINMAAVAVPRFQHECSVLLIARPLHPFEQGNQLITEIEQPAWIVPQQLDNLFNAAVIGLAAAFRRPLRAVFVLSRRRIKINEFFCAEVLSDIF